MSVSVALGASRAARYCLFQHNDEEATLMARAGFCNQCGEYVWLQGDGSCMRGHGAQDIARAYEAEPHPEAAPPVVLGQAPPAPSYNPTAAAPGSAGYAPGPSGYGSVPAPSAAPEKSNKALIITLVLVVVLVCGLFSCGMCASISIPAMRSSQINAQGKMCIANERMLEAAAQAYGANNGRLPASLEDLVRDGEIPKIPTCPNGDKYIYDPSTGKVTCPRHGGVTGGPTRTFPTQ